MTKRRRRLIFLAVGLIAIGWILAGPIIAYLGGPLRWATDDGTFLFKPYIQIGDAPHLTNPERAEVLWHTADRDQDWWVEVRPGPGMDWVRLPTLPAPRHVRLPDVDPHRIYRVPISELVPGERFGYRVGIAARTLFEAEARARPPVGKAYRVAIVGDIGAGTTAASRIAWRIGESKPDLMVVTGDIVYSRGRISEYSTRFFPVYNADAPSRDVGTPLLRSTLVVAAPGNHDLLVRDLDAFPDGLAFFLAWSQPLNGPLGLDAKNSPVLGGSQARKSAYLDAAGPTYPRMANFSFDFGDAHWTVLDANSYVDWTDPLLRAWVERDIASAPPGAWRLVAFHQPGFNSSVAHQPEQQMRLLADIFERGGVTIAFGGHVHNYQRSKPMTFTRRPWSDGRVQGPYGQVDGEWSLDLDYNGRDAIVPKGVIYVITGAGGASLHDTIRASKPETWHSFTERFVSTVHSFTLMDVNRDRLAIRQVDIDGAVVDEFAVTRRMPAP